MKTLQADMQAFRRELQKGSIQRAYRALIAFMLGLRAHFQKSAPGYAVSGLYQGHLDMSYFALFPPALKRRDLKIAIVFDYTTFRFEAWLAARNRKVQRQYWELFRKGRWAEYRVVEPGPGVDSIIECDLAQDFDLADPAALTATIETATAAFIADLERFLAKR
jgi:hypothetical protein